MATETSLKVRLLNASKTHAEWTSADPVLKKGEIAYSSDKKQIRVGDGSSKWSQLSYIDAGHIVGLSNSGSTITYTKADGSTGTITLPEYKVATSTTPGLVKSGGDITVASDGAVTVNVATKAKQISGAAGSVNVDRHVWFSDSAIETARTYDDDFTYNPNTNVLKAKKIDGVELTGTPKAPTATAGTNTTQIATTAFVQNTVTNATDDIEIGGRNLLLSTGNAGAWTIATNSNNYGTYDFYKTYKPVPTIFKIDDYVTISFDWSTNATEGNFHVECGAIAPWVWGTVVSSTGTRNSASNYVDVSSSNQSGHVVITFKITSAVASAAETLQWLRIRADGTGMNGKTFTVSNTKAEKGNKATDWTPAPEDLVSSLSLSGSTLAYKNPVGAQLGTVSFSKSTVGLENVDNTSDANKPISTATQAALDKKVDKASSVTSGTSLNNYSTSGFYKLSNSHTEVPASNYTSGQLLVSRGNGDTIAQIVMPYTASEMYLRTGNPFSSSDNGTWKDWVRIIDKPYGDTLYLGKTATATAATRLTTNTSYNYSEEGLTWFNVNGTAGAAVQVNDTPTTGWWHILRMNHTNTNAYYTDLAIPFNSKSIYYKIIRNGAVVDNKWVKVLDEDNYQSYALPLSGGTLTGHLSISHATSADMSASSTNPRITFADSGGQPVHLMYTEYDSYRAPAGLKIVGGKDASPAWFEVEGDIYESGKKLSEKYLLLTGGTMTSPIAIKHTANAGSVYMVDESIITATPFSSVWHDLLAFCRRATPTYYTSTDGSTWTAATLDKELFAHKDYRTTTVLNDTIKGSRWEWTSGNFAWSNAFWLRLGLDWVSTPAYFNVIVEQSSDGSTWTNMGSATRVHINTNYAFIRVNSFSQNRFRITITRHADSAEGAILNVNSIQLLSLRPGGQGYGPEYSFPYTWDGDMNITMSGNLFLDKGMQAQVYTAKASFTTTGGKLAGLVAGTSRLYSNGLVMSNPTTTNDQAWIRITGTGETDTVLEIATGDDAGAGEKIVVRQYNASNAAAREATLLNTDGSTSFPVKVTAPIFVGKVQAPGVSTNWNKGRDNALVRTTTLTGYSPLASAKTTNGSWDIGTYNNDSYTDDLVFTYITDTDYANANKTTAQIKFLEDGTIIANLAGNATTATTANTLVTLGRVATANTLYGDGKVRYVTASSSMTEGKPIFNGTAGDANVLHLAWDNAGGYDSQIAQKNNTGELALRGMSAGTWSSWRTVLDSSNYTAYASPKAGSTSLNQLAATITLGDGNSATIDQNGATYRQRINIVDNSTNNDAVFTFQQSTDSGSSYTTLMEIDDDGNVIATTFTGKVSTSSLTIGSSSAITSVRNNTAVGALGFSSTTADAAVLVNSNTLAYWNGAYSGTSSNLAYCTKGAFGSIVTKNTGDYLSIGGGRITNDGWIEFNYGYFRVGPDKIAWYATNVNPPASDPAATISYDTSAGAILVNGTVQMGGPIKWPNSTALPEASTADYMVTIDSFANGGTQKWIGVSKVNVGSASAVLDSGNSTKTTFKYSAAGLGYSDFTWLAGWNGYELRAVNKGLFLASTGGTVSGTIKVTTSNAIRMAPATGNYASILHCDGSNFYVLCTNANDKDGSYNSLRPFVVNLYNGVVSMYNVVNLFGGMYSNNPNNTSKAWIVARATYHSSSCTQEAYVGATNATHHISLTSGSGGGSAGVWSGTKSKWLISINSSGTVTANTSDIRYKNDLGLTSDEEVMAILSNVHIHNFTYKDDENKLEQNGIFAQELRDVLIEHNLGMRPSLLIQKEGSQEIYYDLNTPEEDVIYSVAYDKFVPLLWRGWQMHETKLAKLSAHEQRIIELENRVRELELQLNYSEYNE